MNSRTDGSPLTASVSVLVTIDNGTQTGGGGTLTHKGNGHWNYAPTQGETNGNHIVFTFTHSTGVNQSVNVYTVGYDPQDIGATVWAYGTRTLTAFSTALALSVWDVLESSIATASSIGLKVKNNLDAAITSRLASGNVTVGTNLDKTGYSIGSGGIANTAFAAGAIDSAALAASAGQEIADEMLNRDIAGGGSGGARIVRDAFRALRNRVRINSGTLEVYQENDSTVAWSAPVTTSAGNPVTEVDPT